MRISVVIPAYKCASCIEELYKRLVSTLEKITSFEIIFVNDASPQNDWEIITKLANSDKRVKGINFSRNFGQHFAIAAGLDYVTGDWIVVMDCDLQDQPEEIIKLYDKAQEGHDIVFGRRHKRKDNFIKKISSRFFYLVYDYFTESKFDNSVSNFSISKKVVIENFKKLREHSQSFPFFIKWIGFKIGYCDIEHAERKNGKSSYNFKKLINFAIDGIVSQSNRPLKLSIKFGCFLSFFSFSYIMYLVIRYFIQKIPVDGWTSIMVSIWFIGGLLFANMGLIGLYIGKIFDETKDRPIYIVKETINLNKDKLV